MPENDDVNDAAWILIHTCVDIANLAARPREFTAEERFKLMAHAELYCAVYDRYNP